MRTMVLACVLVAVGGFLLTSCATAPKTQTSRADLRTEAQRAIDLSLNTDPGLRKFYDTAAGYAIFPEVGKGAVGVGGAFGRGILYEKGQPTGYASLTQATVGLALGGQSYTEIIFFETPEAVNKFKSGDLAFAAQASAVALKSGVSATADYADNVLVFTMGEAGLMVEASIGGQKFNFEPFGTTTASAPVSEEPAGAPAATARR